MQDICPKTLITFVHVKKVVHLYMFSDLFCWCQLHGPPWDRQHTCSATLFLCLSFLLLHPIPFPTPISQWFMWLSLSNLFPLCVGTSLWLMVISPARACRQNLSLLSRHAGLIKEVARSPRWAIWLYHVNEAIRSVLSGRTFSAVGELLLSSPLILLLRSLWLRLNTDRHLGWKYGVSYVISDNLLI